VQFQPVSNPTAIHVSAGGRQGVEVGDAVTVDSDGQARLRFSDFLVVDVYRDTELSSIEYTTSLDPDAPPVFKMRLEGGSMFSTVDAQVIAGRRVRPEQRIDTEWAVIKALGTRYWVHYDPDREITWVVVKEGVVSVTGAGVEVLVQAGQQTWVEPGKAPVDPIPACRNLIGDLFPLIDDLTNQARPDLELLCQNSEELDSAPIAAPAAATETATATATRRSTPTARPSPTHTPTPSVVCPMIDLMGPGEGAVFTGANQDVTLTWQSSRPLAPGEFYVVTSSFDHNGEIWQDTQETTQNALTLPTYLNDLLTGRRQLDWNVSVWRKDGGGSGTQICSNSASRRLTWEPTPPEPPTPTHTPPPFITPTPTTYTGRLAEPATPSQLAGLGTILGAGFLLALLWAKDIRHEG
jgi:hypothetical protein